MKQYCIRDLGFDRYEIIKVNDGKVEGFTVADGYELDEQISKLERLGWCKAEYVPNLEKAASKAETAYREAIKRLEEGRKHPLIVRREDAFMYLDSIDITFE